MTNPLTSPNPNTKGVRTSEFWLTALTVVLYVMFAFLPPDVVQRWGAAHGWIGGFVVVVYVAGRSYVKGKANGS